MARTAACSKVRFVGLGRELVLASTHVLGVGALSDAEHLIAWLETAHVLPDRLHDPGHVRADDGVLWRAEAVAREAYRVRQTRHDVPDVPTHAGRVHANQYLIVRDLGDVDVPEFQDIGWPVGVPDHCLHVFCKTSKARMIFSLRESGWRARGCARLRFLPSCLVNTVASPCSRPGTGRGCD